MQKISKVGSLIVIGSAAIGGIVATMELLDRVSPTIALTDEGEAQMTGQKGVIPTIDSASQTDVAIQATPLPDPPAQSELPAGSPLETRLAGRVAEVLVMHACNGVEVTSVSAVSRDTLAADSTSGFDSVYIEGSVVLTLDQTPHRLRLLGTGKGPAAEANAIDMAIQQLAEQIFASPHFSSICRKD